MSKPSVGLITLHRVHNFGSALQAYATQSFLNANGFDTHVIDYWRPTEVDDFESQLKLNFARWNRNVLLRAGFSLLRRKQIERQARTFREFIEGKLKLSDESFYTEEHLRNSQQKYDFYCVGSDQVWNADYHVAGPSPFFLEFAPEGRPRFSFSSSLGKRNISPVETDYITRNLPGFAGVSVRESSAVEVLADNGIDAELIVDPTLLTDATEWRSLAEAPSLAEDYLLVYQLHRGHDLSAVVNAIARSRGLRPLYLRGFWKPGALGGRNLYDTTVQQFLGLLANASHVVTDSFHGTAFSLNLSRPFTVVHPPKYGERLSSLLKLTGTDHRVSTTCTPNLEAADVDLDNVDKVLQQQRVKAASFLERMLMVASR